MLNECHFYVSFEEREKKPKRTNSVLCNLLCSGMDSWKVMSFGPGLRGLVGCTIMYSLFGTYSHFSNILNDGL